MADRDNPDFLSAESLKDDKVVNKDGEDLGKFEDLMIDLFGGKIAYAALSFGGTLGLGDKFFAIPWQALSLRVHEHEFVLDIPKEVLEKAEGFDKDNWPITTHESLSNMYSHYGYQPYWEAGIGERMRLPGHEVPETRARESSEFLRASKIQGEKVVNRNGDDLGKIEDIMIDIHDGKIAYAVISHGGILGLGSKHIAVPWQALSLRAQDNAFVVDIPKETIDNAEGLDKDKWPVTYEELSRTFSYYGFQPYWQTGEAAGMAGVSTATAAGIRESERAARTEPERPAIVETEEERQARLERERMEAERQPRMDTERAASVEAAGVPHFLSADTIKSDKVVNPAGEDLGKIEELMIDLESGRIAYAVLSFGGFLGIANKLFAIPWQALKLRPHEHTFTLDIPKEVLERAEGFDKDHWPLTRDALSETYVYYGYRPYWQMESTGQPEVSRRAERTETEVRETTRTKTKEEPVETAEELIAKQEKERIEKLEEKETDKERLERLEKEKMVAERREHKYH